MFIYICNLQIRQKKHSESMIRYWIEDDLGGFSDGITRLFLLEILT